MNQPREHVEFGAEKYSPINAYVYVDIEITFKAIATHNICLRTNKANAVIISIGK